MKRVPHNATVPEIVEAWNEFAGTTESLPPQKGNGKKYIGGGAIGVAVSVVIYVISLLISQNTEMVASRKDAEATQERVKVVETRQDRTIELLNETIANTKVLAAQVDAIVARLERMDRTDDK